MGKSIPQALIIDDNLMNIDVLQMMLEREGIDCAVVNKPGDVRRAVDETTPIDVVFLDLEFSNGGGFQLFKELSALPKLKDVPIVAFTVDVNEINRARQAGFHSFLGKPLSMNRFPDQIKRILDGTPVWEI